MSIRTFFGYNDNVNVVPDVTFFNGETYSTYAGVTIDGTYRFIDDAQWTLGAGMHFDRIWYFNDQDNFDPGTNEDADEYNLLVIQPTVFAEYRFLLGAMPASVGAAYTFRYEELDEINSGGLMGNTLDLTFGFNPCPSHPNLWLGAQYTISYQDFEIDNVATSAINRSGLYQAISLIAEYSWDARLRRVSLRYTYGDFDCVSPDFEYDAHAVAARFESHIVGPLWVSLDLGYRHADYAGGSTFVPPRTRQEIFSAGVSLIFVIDRNWSLDVTYGYEQIDSNSRRFEGEINNVSLGVTFRF